MKRILAAFVLCVACASAADSASDAVLRADQQRLAAMMAGDGAALGRLMSDELRFVHSDGRIETKADYIKNMLAGDTAYVGAKTFDVEARQPSADVVILIGRQEMRKKLGTTWSDIKLHFMSVWRNEAGTWRMYAWESMKPAGTSIVPGKKS